MFSIFITFLTLLGLLTLWAFTIWVLYVAIYKNGYRLFCGMWWKEVFRPGSYLFELKHYYQRLRYGISYSDAWDFDTHLLKIIPIGLEHVRDSGLAPDLSPKDWDDMIEGIRNDRHIRKCHDLDCPLSHTQIQKDFEHAMKLLTKHFDMLWI